MRAKSVATCRLDAYRAGLELGEGLRELAPEVVFLFSSIHYEGNPELLEGLHDGLENEPVVIGATGDGFYESETVAEIGASALGLNSGGRVQWHFGAAAGVAADLNGALDRCLTDLTAATGGVPLSLCIVFTDFHADATALVDGLAKRVDAPTIGGLAGDEYRMERCFVYAGRKVLADGLVILGATGDLRFAIHVAGDLRPVGLPGVVTAAAGTRLETIDGIPAMAFITAQIGKPLSMADIGISAFQLTGSEDPNLYTLRTIRHIEGNDGSVTLFGSVRQGQHIQFCHASPDVIVQGVRAVSAQLGRESGEPAAGLVVSCAGRKQVLGRDLDHEVGAIQEGYGRVLPLAGFPSFGEIGPRRNATGYTRTLSHNMTYILLVFDT
ncbi:MAG: FIST C-terminal domain-containing protein [Candidatus Krumholzibacteria bacterium]|nr:FIST C-terminal domain-containing protein [Candidatus Krumholzibacteria bacterium]